MIKDFHIEKKKMHFRTPFKIAYEEVETADIVVLALTDEFGNVGLGSAAPDTEVTGETVDEVAEVLTKKLNSDFFSTPVSEWYRYHEQIEQVFHELPSAQSAVEEAILNLWSLEHKLPLSSLFGGYRSRCPIMITVGIKDMIQTSQEVQKRLAEGFNVIKLKVGLNVKEDLERVKMMRESIPADKSLILDANQGYSARDAEKLLKGLKGLDITAIEQPVASRDLENLKALHLSTPIPIIADESVVSVNHALEILTGDYASGVNIKLMKCGGPVNFMRIFHLARSMNKIIMIGCMYESNISITMGANLALGLPIDFVDLDSGAMDFDDDPAIGGAEVSHGMIAVRHPLRLK